MRPPAGFRAQLGPGEFIDQKTSLATQSDSLPGFGGTFRSLIRSFKGFGGALVLGGPRCFGALY